MTELTLAYPTLVGSLSESRLLQFEQKLGRRLPDQFRRFLLSTNGGVPRPTGLKFYNKVEGEEQETALECYFALHDESIPDKAKWRYHQSLEKVWENVLQKNQPGSTLVPIGRDVSGNLVCIETAPSNECKSVLWDHDYDEIFPLSESLAQLHGSLFSLADDDDEREPERWMSR